MAICVLVANFRWTSGGTGSIVATEGTLLSQSLIGMVVYVRVKIKTSE